MDNLPSDIRLSFLTLLRLIPLNNKASVWQKTWSIPRCFQTQHTYSIQLLSCFVLWRSTRPSRTNIQKRCPFHYRGLECKSRKSRNTWSNRQIRPWSTEWSRAKANRVLPSELTGHSKHSSDNTREDSIHGHPQMVNTKIRLIIFFAAKDGEALYSQQKQDRELTVAQTMNSLLPNSDLNWESRENH